MNPLSIPLAYKYVALIAMLVEINYCSERLQLSVEKPVMPNSLNSVYFAHPYVTEFGGTIDTTNYSFVFAKDGILRRIQRINKFKRIPLRDLENDLSHVESLVDTNSAFELATNWLYRLSVDVGALERQHSHSVEQKWFYQEITNDFGSPLPNGNKTLLPIFHVFWGSRKAPTVFISIYGPTKEILCIYQNDDSFSHRAKAIIRDKDKLLSIKDEDYAQFTLLEKSNLVVQYCVDTNRYLIDRLLNSEVDPKVIFDSPSILKVKR